MKETISFLITQICKAHRQKANELLSQVELHAGQEMLLLRLWEQNGQTQSEIADSMCIQAPTLTTMLQRMENAGLIERQKDPDDHRVSRVYLTNSGRVVQNSVENVWTQLENTTLTTLTLEEKLFLRRLLLQVHTNLTTSESVHSV